MDNNFNSILKRIRKEKIDIEKNAPTTNPQSRNNGNPKGPKLKLKKPVKAETVSYTHLTLPTIA